MNTTKEKKMQEIQEAVELYKQAHELVNKANKLITKNIRGLSLVSGLPDVCESWDYKDYKGKLDVHVHSGLLKLAKVLEVEAEPEWAYDGTKINNRKAIVLDDVKFFQIGCATQSKYCYK